MRRHLALAGLAMAATTTMFGGGIFAVFTDRATTGSNDASTRAERRAADLKLSLDNSGFTFDCQGFVDAAFEDDLTTGIFSIQNMEPGNAWEVGDICLRNQGSSSITVQISVIDLIDLDIACTGDEATAGDSTCGGDQQGEASPSLLHGIIRIDCVSNSQLGSHGGTVAGMAATPVPMPPSVLAPGETACLRFTVNYVPNEHSMQTAQSDKVTWRYAFDGTAS